MTVQIIDSDRRCPYDTKRMAREIGQDDTTGWTRTVHICLHCPYTEIDENWKRPKIVVATGPTMADRLKAQRLGIAVRWQDFVYPGEVPGGPTTPHQTGVSE